MPCRRNERKTLIAYSATVKPIIRAAIRTEKLYDQYKLSCPEINPFIIHFARQFKIFLIFVLTFHANIDTKNNFQK